MSQLASIEKTEALDAFLQTEVAVLEFGAVDRCPPCRVLQPILEELAGEYAGSVGFGQVDADEFPELASRYQVMGLPTVIVFKNGVPEDKLIGLRSKEAYRTVIDRSKGH